MEVKIHLAYIDMAKKIAIISIIAVVALMFRDQLVNALTQNKAECNKFLTKCDSVLLPPCLCCTCSCYTSANIKHVCNRNIVSVKQKGK